MNKKRDLRLVYILQTNRMVMVCMGLLERSDLVVLVQVDKQQMDLLFDQVDNDKLDCDF